MKFTQKIPYSIRRVLPIFCIAGASMFTSCSKDNHEDEPARDVELYFDQHDISQIDINNIQKYANDASVKNIYMIPQEKPHWTNLGSHNITKLRQILQQRTDISPKVKGRGNFKFRIGIPSEVPADSLWLEQHGWKVNADLHQQKQR